MRRVVIAIVRLPISILRMMNSTRSKTPFMIWLHNRERE